MYKRYCILCIIIIIIVYKVFSLNADRIYIYLYRLRRDCIVGKYYSWEGVYVRPRRFARKEGRTAQSSLWPAAVGQPTVVCLTVVMATILINSKGGFPTPARARARACSPLLPRSWAHCAPPPRRCGISTDSVHWRRQTRIYVYCIYSPENCLSQGTVAPSPPDRTPVCRLAPLSRPVVPVPPSPPVYFPIIIIITARYRRHELFYTHRLHELLLM